MKNDHNWIFFLLLFLSFKWTQGKRKEEDFPRLPNRARLTLERENGGYLPRNAFAPRSALAPVDAPVTVPGLVRVPSSGSKCVVCGATVAAGFTVVPTKARFELLLDHHLLLPPDSNCRMCQEHLNGEHLRKDLVITSNFQVDDDSEAMLTTDQAGNTIVDLVEAMRFYRDLAHLNFDDEAMMSDEDYHTWTGWTKEQFTSFVVYLQKARMRSSTNRTLRESLAVFWIKIKADLSFSQIASLLGIKEGNLESGRLRARDAFTSVREALATHFVPCFLGPDHLTPDQAKAHNTIYSTKFFGDKPTTIWDGTYLYTYRSLNYSAGRKFYSMHKGRTLAKFMSIVLPDGYVLDTIGPFASNGDNNDAAMTSQILKTAELGMENWVKTGDQNIVVDRGFRNIVERLQSMGVKVYMPTVSNKKQDDVKEANQTRLVTKVRWVVEAYHGRLKKFKFFENRQHPRYYLEYSELIKITTAPMNALRPVLYDTSTDRRMHSAIADKMLRLANEETNPVAVRVTSGPLSTRGKNWDPINARIQPDESELNTPDVMPDFPTLPLEELQNNITLGTYQIKQAAHYTDEHLHNEGGFTIYIHKSADDLIRARIQSRHRNSTKYFTWVQFKARSTRSRNGEITGWYCQCKAGMRVVGCCAHVATVIWYLAYARHQDYQIPKGYEDILSCFYDAKGSGFEDSDEEVEGNE